MYNFFVNFNDENEFERLTERFARQAQDQDDLQNEIAGRDVGRIGRFLPEDARSAGLSGKSKQERAEALTRLQMALLSNPAYAALFRETEQALNDAQTRLDTVLERVRRAIKESEDALDDKRNHAARLEDGTRVYRDKDGSVRTEDGEIVAQALAAGVIWKGDEQTYESMQKERDRTDKLKAIEQDAINGQAQIGAMQDDLHDEDNPKTEDELNTIKEDAEAIVSDLEDRMDNTLSKSLDADAPAAGGARPSGVIIVPEL